MLTKEDQYAYQSIRLDELNNQSTNLSEYEEFRFQLTQRSSQNVISLTNALHVYIGAVADRELTLTRARLFTAFKEVGGGGLGWTPLQPLIELEFRR